MRRQEEKKEKEWNEKATAAAAKTIRQVTPFRVEKFELICAPESLGYQKQLINCGKSCKWIENRENRLEMLTCPKGKERTKPYHDCFFFSITYLNSLLFTALAEHK